MFMMSTSHVPLRLDARPALALTQTRPAPPANLQRPNASDREYYETFELETGFEAATLSLGSS